MQKKILFYCQHSVGVGHLVRSFALVNSLKKSFQVTFISGGDFPQGMRVPKGVDFVQLPPVGIDANNCLVAEASEEPVHLVMKKRQKKIQSVYEETLPDLIITEYFPFGKIQFIGELIPILKRIKNSKKSTQVICSLRDVLEPTYMATKMAQDFSAKMINEYYDRVLIHGDENFIAIGDTCPHLSRLNVPVHYTGYVTNESYRPRINRNSFNEIVVSAGGGKVAHPFIYKTIKSFKNFGFGEGVVLRVIPGPLYPKDDWETLQDYVKNDHRIILERSVESLSNLWLQARLSISSGGYNTLMELVCSRVPALVAPYSNGTNSEQKIRSLQLHKLELIKTIDYEIASEEKIATAVKAALDFIPSTKELDLNGAENTRALLAGSS